MPTLNSKTCPPPAPAIAARGVHKVFRDFWRRPRAQALAGVTLDLAPGTVLGLLGPNGSGKSTLLKLLVGLLHPTAGTVRVLGHDPRTVAVRARLGYLPESAGLYPGLTGEETLHYFGRFFDLDRATRRRRVDELLAMVGLDGARRRAVGEYSRGMARRLGLAQALINDPELVILDEPTAGLDPPSCRLVKDLVRALARRGKTVVLSSHLLADMEDVCQRVVILSAGRIQAEGPLDRMLEQPDAYTLSLADVPTGQRAEITAAILRITGQAPAWGRPHRNLEDFFLATLDRAQADGAAPSGAAAAPARLAPFLDPQPAGDAAG